MLEIRGLTKRFGDRVALDGLTMGRPPGQVVGLLGPNGSGKTTAMRIAFGVIDADEGEVLYGGEPIRPAMRRRFGYMPEERGLYSEMRVRDQLAYFARLAGLSRERAQERAARCSNASGWPTALRSPSRRCRSATSSACSSRPRSSTSPRPSCSTSRSRASGPWPWRGCRRSSPRPRARGAWCSSPATRSTSSRGSASRSP